MSLLYMENKVLKVAPIDVNPILSVVIVVRCEE